MSIEEKIQQMIDESVNRALEARIPEYLRAVGIAEVQDEGELVDAVEIARLLGLDVSSPEKTRAATNRVYTLARQNRLPSVRISPRCIRFNLAKVKEVLEKGGNAEPQPQVA